MKKQKGLTLVELVIVISIIAVLALIAISFFRSQIFKGNDAKRKSDLNRIKIAVEEYEKDHDCYPPPQLVTCSPGNGLQRYLDSIPCDPSTHASYYYDYQNSTCASWFRVYADLENKNDSAVLSSCGPNGAFNFYTSSPSAPDCNLVNSNNFYGCKGGVCVPIFWDSQRNGPECDPNFQDATCYGRCGSQAIECKDWTQQ